MTFSRKSGQLEYLPCAPASVAFSQEYLSHNLYYTHRLVPERLQLSPTQSQIDYEHRQNYRAVNRDPFARFWSPQVQCNHQRGNGYHQEGHAAERVHQRCSSSCRRRRAHGSSPRASSSVRPPAPTISFFGRRPGPWPAHATGFSPKFVGKPSCGDVARADANPAPPGRESRSAGTCP
jgi:hypothetical protein